MKGVVALAVLAAIGLHFEILQCFTQAEEAYMQSSEEHRPVEGSHYQDNIINSDSVAHEDTQENHPHHNAHPHFKMTRPSKKGHKHHKRVMPHKRHSWHRLYKNGYKQHAEDSDIKKNKGSDDKVFRVKKTVEILIDAPPKSANSTSKSITHVTHSENAFTKSDDLKEASSAESRMNSEVADSEESVTTDHELPSTLDHDHRVADLHNESIGVDMQSHEVNPKESSMYLHHPGHMDEKHKENPNLASHSQVPDEYGVGTVGDHFDYPFGETETHPFQHSVKHDHVNGEATTTDPDTETQTEANYKDIQHVEGYPSTPSIGSDENWRFVDHSDADMYDETTFHQAYAGDENAEDEINDEELHTVEHTLHHPTSHAFIGPKEADYQYADEYDNHVYGHDMLDQNGNLEKVNGLNMHHHERDNKSGVHVDDQQPEEFPMGPNSQWDSQSDDTYDNLMPHEPYKGGVISSEEDGRMNNTDETDANYLQLDESVVDNSSGHKTLEENSHTWTHPQFLENEAIIDEADDNDEDTATAESGNGEEMKGEVDEEKTALDPEETSDSLEPVEEESDELSTGASLRGLRSKGKKSKKNHKVAKTKKSEKAQKTKAKKQNKKSKKSKKSKAERKKDRKRKSKSEKKKEKEEAKKHKAEQEDVKSELPKTEGATDHANKKESTTTTYSSYVIEPKSDYALDKAEQEDGKSEFPKTEGASEHEEKKESTTSTYSSYASEPKSDYAIESPKKDEDTAGQSSITSPPTEVEVPSKDSETTESTKVDEVVKESVPHISSTEAAVVENVKTADKVIESGPTEVFKYEIDENNGAKSTETESTSSVIHHPAKDSEEKKVEDEEEPGDEEIGDDDEDEYDDQSYDENEE
ncbi:uncharacterized protein BXIN_2060 [Babesia sp. Xinjiang]|uniref:uncharacterized protein n=1 Tax=Babesia sp. Xinjiang TaxID=462227 RepID=UPI000A23C29D|nr:uncharacterized protein BXIN_2060 [Babesia sp. Xinjiang]ORM40604.1 hypothetical protein BXIN_2060 [Babesia sp. Xinjiang]